MTAAQALSCGRVTRMTLAASALQDCTLRHIRMLDLAVSFVAQRVPIAAGGVALPPHTPSGGASRVLHSPLRRSPYPESREAMCEAAPDPLADGWFLGDDRRRNHDLGAVLECRDRRDGGHIGALATS